MDLYHGITIELFSDSLVLTLFRICKTSLSPSEFKGPLTGNFLFSLTSFVWKFLWFWKCTWQQMLLSVDSLIKTWTGMEGECLFLMVSWVSCKDQAWFLGQWVTQLWHSRLCFLLICLCAVGTVKYVERQKTPHNLMVRGLGCDSSNPEPKLECRSRVSWCLWPLLQRHKVTPYLEGASGPFSPGESAVFPPKEVFVKAVHIALRPACDRSSVFSMSWEAEIEQFLPCSHQLVVAEPWQQTHPLLQLVSGIQVVGWLQFQQWWGLKCLAR